MLVLATLATRGHTQERGGAVARADAQAQATNGSSRTATHRVVVENGKTVVDERTEHGKPVGSGAPADPLPPLPGVGSPEDLLRELEAQMGRQLGEAGGVLPLPPAGAPTKPRVDPVRPVKPPVRGAVPRQPGRDA